MANGKSAIVAPMAFNDFAKSNGTSSADHAFFTEGPSMTRQEFAAECDINTIMAQYDKYLSDPMMTLRQQQAKYLDLDSVPQTLMESMQILKDGEEAFYRLPAVVRREFDNDPVAFVDYALDPTNLDVMRDWGLAPPAPKAPEVPLASPPKAGEPGGAADPAAPGKAAPAA